MRIYLTIDMKNKAGKTIPAGKIFKTHPYNGMELINAGFAVLVDAEGYEIEAVDEEE